MVVDAVRDAIGCVASASGKLETEGRGSSVSDVPSRLAMPDREPLALQLAVFVHPTSSSACSLADPARPFAPVMASTAIRRIRRSSVARIGEHLCSSSSFGDWAGGTAPALAGWRQRRDASTAPAGAPATSFVACAIGEFSKFDPESQTVRYTPGSQEARSLLAQLQELAGQQEHFDTVSRVRAAPRRVPADGRPARRDTRVPIRKCRRSRTR